MTLDLPTLVPTLGVGFALLTLQLWLAGRGGLRRASAAGLALCLGFALFGLQDWLPAWLVLLGGHWLLMAGLAGLSGLLSRHLLNRAPPAWHHGLLLAAVLLVPALLAAAPPLRAGALSAAMGALLLPVALAALRLGWRGEPSLRAVALGLGAALALGRAAQAWQGGIFALAFLAVLATGFAFVLAYFERMAGQMRKLASVDGLTGAMNHATTLSLLSHALERGRREGQPVGFVMLDLDHFKRVNDRHGHAVGDQVLKAVAAATRARLRGSDVLGRLGGEEFGLVLPATGEAGARHLAEQVRQAVEALELRGDGGQPLRVTLSAGVAEAARDDTPETLMHLADKALYQAKQRGRNRVVVADDWLRHSTLQSAVG
jgi:diguanylate cyclase (GGDEF)-like protein